MINKQEMIDKLMQLYPGFTIFDGDGHGSHTQGAEMYHDNCIVINNLTGGLSATIKRNGLNIGTFNAQQIMNNFPGPVLHFVGMGESTPQEFCKVDARGTILATVRKDDNAELWQALDKIVERLSSIEKSINSLRQDLDDISE